MTVLARSERYGWVRQNGLVLQNEITGQKGSSRVSVVNELKPDDEYDLVIVLIRRNKLLPVFKSLAASSGPRMVRGSPTRISVSAPRLGAIEYGLRITSAWRPA